MPLNNVIIQAHYSTENVNDQVIFNNTQISLDQQDGVLPRAVKLRFMPAAYGFQTSEGSQIGSWRIGTKDITISGVKPEFNSSYVGWIEGPDSPSYLTNTEFGYLIPNETFFFGVTFPQIYGPSAPLVEGVEWLQPGYRINDVDFVAGSNYAVFGDYDVPLEEDNVIGLIPAYIENPEADQFLEGGDWYSNFENADLESLQTTPGFQTEYIQNIIMLDTLGLDEYDRGLPENYVDVYVVLKPDIIMPEGGITIDIDFDGDAVFVADEAQPMPPPPIDFIVNNPDNYIINFTGEGSTTIEESTLNSGSFSQVNKYRVTPRITNELKNSTNKIGSIKIDAKDGYYFSELPRLSTNFNYSIKSTVKSKVISNKKITSCTIDVLYNNSIDLSEENVEASVLFKSKRIVTRENKIDRLLVGPPTVLSNGEVRDIKIYGKPGATFGLAINESFQDDYSNVYTDIDTEYVIDNHNDVSILNRQMINTFVTENYGKNIGILHNTIGKNGVFSFEQGFPSNVSRSTSVDGDVSSSADVIVKNSTDIRKGDIVSARQISSTDTVTVSALNPLGTNEKQLRLSKVVTLDDGSSISFRRNRVYSAYLIPDFTSTLSTNIPTTNPTYRLYQYVDPTITLRASTATSHFNINGGGNGDEYDVIYKGRAFQKSSIKADITLLLDLNTHTQFDTISVPTFNSSNQARSSWTNSVSSENGGTEIKINKIYHNGTGNHTITIYYSFEIISFGNKDIVIDLDLDEIVTYS